MGFAVGGFSLRVPAVPADACGFCSGCLHHWVSACLPAMVAAWACSACLLGSGFLDSGITHIPSVLGLLFCLGYHHLHIPAVSAVSCWVLGRFLPACLPFCHRTDFCVSACRFWVRPAFCLPAVTVTLTRWCNSVPGYRFCRYLGMPGSHSDIPFLPAFLPGYLLFCLGTTFILFVHLEFLLRFVLGLGHRFLELPMPFLWVYCSLPAYTHLQVQVLCLPFSCRLWDTAVFFRCLPGTWERIPAVSATVSPAGTPAFLPACCVSCTDYQISCLPFCLLFCRFLLNTVLFHWMP